MNNVYAQVGSSLQQIGGDCPDGFIEMQSQRPYGDYVAAEAGTWTILTPTLEQVYRLREAAYLAESDSLKLSADYDALTTDSQPDYAEWFAKVQEIKARYPLPSQVG